MHRDNAFITLTYDDAHYSPSLNYRDFQLFLKRARKELGHLRFFMCGEYGELTLRPHFHALLFGRSFSDGVSCGAGIYQSRTLSRLWPFGFSSYGSVTYESAGYVARYAVKKINGDRADAHYSRVDLRTGEIVRVHSEFGHMSLKPGIGYSWFQKYWPEIYVARDGVVRPGGFLVPPPRYYDNLLSIVDSDLRDYKDYERYTRSARFVEDCSPARLLVRERCAKAKLAFLRRDKL